MLKLLFSILFAVLLSMVLTGGRLLADHAARAQDGDAPARTGKTIPLADNVGSVTGYPLPRFVSLRSDIVYVRAGPGMRYPVKWVYQRRNYPLEVIQEFDTWRKIRDSDGEEGWVHQSLLSGNRHVLIAGKAPVTILKKPEPDARPVAQMEPGVVAKLNECADNWCDVSASGYHGWVLKTSLWGVYEREESE